MFVVPSYSQFLDVRRKSWQNKACGVAAVKMVVDFWNGVGKQVRNFTCDDLIDLGLKNDAYLENIGWKHTGLIKIARKLGLAGKNFDWFDQPPKIAFKKIIPWLKKYPVIVSIYLNFRPNYSSHLIVLTSFDSKTIFYNEPAAKTRRGIKRRVSLKKFLRGWKRRIIVIYPKFS
ncbi:MAG: C39 family peptidase [Candidatus Yanofskybacteria bacterium]|nr:C39 family peptidase [Candidatus Yanofskybacteria bacterium]